VKNLELNLLYPLDGFYTRSKLAIPLAHPIDGESVPEPYRRLLVHNGDMTPTLEAFHGERISLRVLARRQEGDTLARQVVLTLDGSARPVEFGAIVIQLQRFPPAAREEVLESRRPLGTILHDHRIEHRSRPRAFLRVTADDVMREALQLNGSHVIYGRRNVILNAEGDELADIVEILPPVKEERVR
jgi:chorismate-pyruvate lyase